MPNIAEPTPDEIRAFRETHGLSQAALGEALGSSARTIEDWEAARRKPPAMLRLALAAIAVKLDPAPEALQRRFVIEARLSQSIDRLANLASVKIAEQTDDERFDWAQAMAVDAAVIAADWYTLRSAPLGGFQAPGLFEVYKDRAGEWRARYLINRQTIFATEGYSEKAGAIRAVRIIQNEVSSAPIVTDGPLGKSKFHFFVYQDAQGLWRAQFKYQSETIFATEAYASSLGLTSMIFHLQNNLNSTPIEQSTPG